MTAITQAEIAPVTPDSRSFLLTLAYLRHKFFQTSFARSFVAVAVGGAIIASLSAGLGILAAG